jgi:Flp pilus assembly pilin Flp
MRRKATETGNNAPYTLRLLHTNSANVYRYTPFSILKLLKFNDLNRKSEFSLGIPKMHECGPNRAPIGWLYLPIRDGNCTNERPVRDDPARNQTLSETPEEGLRMLNFIKNFRRDEDGAVTVDWVVLTAALVGIGIAVIGSIDDGTTAMGDKMSTMLEAQKTATY